MIKPDNYSGQLLAMQETLNLLFSLGYRSGDIYDNLRYAIQEKEEEIK